MDYKTLKELMNLHGVTGDTSRLIRELGTKFSKLGVHNEINEYGVLLVGNTKNPEKALICHVDEVGFQVTRIDQDGSMRIQPVGWVTANRLDHSPIYIMTDKGPVNGVCLHCEPLKTENVTDFSMLKVYCGATSEAQVKAMGIRVGQTGSFTKFYQETDEAIIGTSIDNRISIFIALELLKANPELAKKNLFVFHTDEEIEDHGLHGIGYAFQPKIGIVLDYIPAHQKPAPSDVAPVAGKGPAVVYRGGYYILHEALRELFDTKVKFDFQKVFFSTNSIKSLEPANLENNSVTKGVNICIPAMGYHGATYLVYKSDVEGYLKLVEEVLDLKV